MVMGRKARVSLCGLGLWVLGLPSMRDDVGACAEEVSTVRSDRRSVSVIVWIACILVCCSLVMGCQATGAARTEAPNETTVSQGAAEIGYSYAEYPLERNGIALHLDRMAVEGKTPEKQILLVHGVTYSTHEFDIDYEDYSLVRRLAREGYAVWRLDIAGYGQSEEISDGFLPDSDYAAEDINAAVEAIVAESGCDKIDVLGWSWGTVTTGRFASRHPEHLRRLVLYAPIFCGVGEAEVTEPFHHNSWEHAADDFQTDETGALDHTVADPVVIELFCSSCWHFDGESSPNGGRRDICVSASERLIDASAITVPTLMICGDKDPYLDQDVVAASLGELPEGSALEVIEGASHVAYIEKPYYQDFQDRLVRFLAEGEA